MPSVFPMARLGVWKWEHTLNLSWSNLYLNPNDVLCVKLNIGGQEDSSFMESRQGYYLCHGLSMLLQNVDIYLNSSY